MDEQLWRLTMMLRSKQKMHRTCDEWLATRRRGIGASEAYLAIAEPLTLYAQKVLDDDRNGFDTSPWLEGYDPLQWGHHLESAVRAKVKQSLASRVVNPGKYTVQVHPERPWQMATLDGFLEEPSAPAVDLFGERLGQQIEGPGVVQIKTTSQYRDSEFSNGDWPIEYQAQCQHELEVTGCQWGVLAALIGGHTYRLFPFVRHDPFLEELVAAEADLHDRISDQRPPELTTASKRELRALVRLHPEDSGAIVRASDTALEAAERLQKINDAIRLYTSDKKDLEAKLKVEIGAATYLDCGEFHFSYKTQERPATMPDPDGTPSKFRKLHRSNKSLE